MEGPISSRNQDRQGTTGNQETTPPLSPWPGPFVVSEYVALPGDRIAVAAMDPASGIMCSGHFDREFARADAHALNAAYQLGRRTAEEAVRSAYDHIRMTAIPGGNGHFLVPEAAIAELRSALFPPGAAERRESLVSGRVGRSADPVGRNPDACTNELATAIASADVEPAPGVHAFTDDGRFISGSGFGGERR